MLGDVVGIFGKRFDTIDSRFEKIERDMVTKDDLAKLDVKIDKLDISIHRDLDTIKEQLENVSGFGKEIDHALERTAAIEKHLGISKKIAA